MPNSLQPSAPRLKADPAGADRAIDGAFVEQSSQDVLSGPGPGLRDDLTLSSGGQIADSVADETTAQTARETDTEGASAVVSQNDKGAISQTGGASAGPQPGSEQAQGVIAPGDISSVNVQAQEVQSGKPQPPDAQATEALTQAPGEAPAPDPESEPILEGGSALETLVGADRLKEQGFALFDWVRDNLLTFDVALEAAILVVALAPAALFGPRLKNIIAQQLAPRLPQGVARRAGQALSVIATPIALYLTLQIAQIALRASGLGVGLVSAGVSLLTAWIVIRLVTLVIRSPLWSRVAFYVVWPLAALDAFGALDNVVAELDALAIPLSTTDDGRAIDISALDVVRGAITFGILFWLANTLGSFLKGRINATDELTVSFKALLAKILDILLPIVALLVALQIVNFPFGALAIFGGAIGLGVGLGLQRTVSNFAAGFTLIADKSIKPGDVIEVGDAFGWITEMNARYVSVRTRDGTDHLIPNDKFIEDGVVNWSHTDKIVRLHAGVGVAYGTRDLRGVKAMCEEAALSIDRVAKSPRPVCNLMNFGDSSVDFDLRFWITDPANGTSNVRSDVMLAVWDALHEANIEIPFPQRDLHIKSMPPEAVALDTLASANGAAAPGAEPDLERAANVAAAEKSD